ncbi:uncharacterized protein BKCO1_1000343 [Diplodia corticola]|uniref:Uncharacterized protein n=1 Tax=Diplodia corticola TaxID=236234 RepID=A0A1J9RJN6_9PEZI|nr:uncharacterized protein BKCO1_1000343 [Diplodia corticola]OJD40218.1 hypothetical protein BKCO1_1000343 [Diplodia corticola]
MDCFDPEHKKRGRPRIYDVSINKPTFEIAPKDARHHPTMQPRYAMLPQQSSTPRPEKAALLLPLPQERWASSSQYLGRESAFTQFHLREPTCPPLLRRDSMHLQFRRDSTSSQSSSIHSTNIHTSMLPGAGTPPDTPSGPMWTNPFASEGNKWIYGEGASGKVQLREDGGRSVVFPEAKKGRGLSIDELLC